MVVILVVLVTKPKCPGVGRRGGGVEGSVNCFAVFCYSKNGDHN